MSNLPTHFFLFPQITLILPVISEPLLSKEEFFSFEENSCTLVFTDQEIQGKNFARFL